MSDKYVFERATMEDLADSVRSVVGTSEEMTASEMSSELSNFSTGVGEAITNQDTLIAQINAAIEGKSAGGVVLPELNNPASAENIDSGYEVVDGEGNLLTGTSTKVQLPALSNAASADKILSGYEAIDSIGSKVTGSIGSKAAQTITPSTTDQTIAAGQYLSGDQTIKGDANLIAANILSGKSIFGVVGSVIQGVNPICEVIDTSTTNSSTITLSQLKGKSSFILVGDGDGGNKEITTLSSGILWIVYCGNVNKAFTTYRSRVSWAESFVTSFNSNTGTITCNGGTFARPGRFICIAW